MNWPVDTHHSTMVQRAKWDLTIILIPDNLSEKDGHQSVRKPLLPSLINLLQPLFLVSQIPNSLASCIQMPVPLDWEQHARLDATSQRWLSALSNYAFALQYRADKQISKIKMLTSSRWPHGELLNDAQSKKDQERISRFTQGHLANMETTEVVNQDVAQAICRSQLEKNPWPLFWWMWYHTGWISCSLCRCCPWKLCVRESPWLIEYSCSI